MKYINKKLQTAPHLTYFSKVFEKILFKDISILWTSAILLVNIRMVL